MSNDNIGTIFMNGKSQSVRLPKKYRINCKKVEVKKTKEGILLIPLQDNLDKIFSTLSKYDNDPSLYRHTQPVIDEIEKI